MTRPWLRLTLPVLLAALAGTACSRSSRDVSQTATDEARPRVSMPPDSPAPASTGQEGRGSLMLGTWDIFPTGVAGPHLTIVVDSARQDTFAGRLTRAFAGNMGLDPGTFGPFAGRVGDDSVATLTIALDAPGAPPVEMAGKVAGGEWRLSHFVWGGEQQVVPGRSWTGKRVP